MPPQRLPKAVGKPPSRRDLRLRNGRCDALTHARRHSYKPAIFARFQPRFRPSEPPRAAPSPAAGAQLAVGERVNARERPYGLEFAHGEPLQAFFLVVHDEGARELRTRPVML